MRAGYLKIMMVGLALLFVTQGCSFYAGFSSKQSPDYNGTKVVSSGDQGESAHN